ncbi:MAG: signal peptidase II [Bdellovibrionales bacterium]|nr:signal peptidase II [Bdellovibrionales bacterium]
MQKKDWYLLIICFLILPVLFDQFTKWIVLFLLGDNTVALGPIVLEVYKESLIISNQLNLAQYVKIISSFGFSILFLFLFFVLNLMLTKKIMGFRISITVFVAGMLSDTVDMIFHGASQDWVTLFGAHLNLSDLYLLIGVILVLFFSIKDHALIFRKNELRKTILIEKDQIVFLLNMLFGYVLFIGAVFVFFLSFIKIIFNHFVPISPDTQVLLIRVFFILFSILSICFLLIMVAFLLYISNKIYGPIYAFKKHIRDVFLFRSSVRPFSTRKGDHFSDLSELVDELQSKYIKGGKIKEEKS